MRCAQLRKTSYIELITILGDWIFQIFLCRTTYHGRTPSVPTGNPPKLLLGLYKRLETVWWYISWSNKNYILILYKVYVSLVFVYETCREN